MRRSRCLAALVGVVTAASLLPALLSTSVASAAPARFAQQIIPPKADIVVDATTGKVVAVLANGDGVDALGWDDVEKLMYIPAGRDGTVTVYHEDAPDRYTRVAVVKTMPGVKTIAVDQKRHVAYGFTPEYGPAPARAPGETGPPGRFPRRGPVIGTAFFTITH
jgi:hypothetical protein